MPFPICPSCKREWDDRDDLCPRCGKCAYACCQCLITIAPDPAVYESTEDAADAEWARARAWREQYEWEHSL